MRKILYSKLVKPPAPPSFCNYTFYSLFRFLFLKISLFTVCSFISLFHYVELLYFFNINLFILIGGKLLYSIVLVLPYINMSLPQVYTCSPSWTGNSFHIWYYTCFNAVLPNHPTLALSHRVQNSGLYICVSFAVSYTGLLLPSF